MGHWYYIIEQVDPPDQSKATHKTVDQGSWKILYREATREKATAHLELDDDLVSNPNDFRPGVGPDAFGRRLWASSRYHHVDDVLRLGMPSR